jgi:hypothetical protein
VVDGAVKGLNAARHCEEAPQALTKQAGGLHIGTRRPDCFDTLRASRNDVLTVDR